MADAGSGGVALGRLSICWAGPGAPFWPRIVAHSWFDPASSEVTKPLPYCIEEIPGAVAPVLVDAGRPSATTAPWKVEATSRLTSTRESV
jgi:hypothetical protein